MADRPLRIVVTACRLDLGGTSEGSCSVKYVNLLVRRGHDVTVLNGDDALTESPAAWLPGAKVVDVGLEPVDGDGSRRSAHLAALSTHVRGFSAGDRARQRRWAVALDRAVLDAAPDVVITRGAGLDYSPHVAMLARADSGPAAAGPRVAWVAHYHDPWPLSVYPDPYRRHEGLVSWRQEAVSRRILGAAGAVTFPSARLRRWQASRSGVDLGDRGVVVAHLGTDGDLVPGLDVPPPWTSASSDGGSGRAGARESAGGPVRLVHAGTLMRQRDPRPILDALATVAAGEGSGPSPIRLRLVGSLDAKLVAAPWWKPTTEPLEAAGVLDVAGAKVGYRQSMGELGAADVLVVFAVGTPESPAFPAKLADVFSLGRPALVIAPRASGPADLVDVGSPSYVDGDRPDDIERALRDVIVRHRAGTLGELVPTAEQRRAVGPDAVGDAIEHAIEVARATLVRST